jgi:hypothetical protein
MRNEVAVLVPRLRVVKECGGDEVIGVEPAAIASCREMTVGRIAIEWRRFVDGSWLQTRDRLTEAPASTHKRVLDRHECLFQCSARIRRARGIQAMHEMAERVRGNHNAAGRPVVVPPPLITLRTEEIWKRRKLEQQVLLADRLRQIDVLVLGEDRVVWDCCPNVQFHQPATGWSVRGLAPRIWTSYLAKLRAHHPFIQVGSGWAKTSAHARIPSGFSLSNDPLLRQLHRA